jgi:hypothetical protein
MAAALSRPGGPDSEGVMVLAGYVYSLSRERLTPRGTWLASQQLS